MDETYIKVKSVWKYLYRAVDKQGKTVDFLLTAKRDMAAAKRFFDKAMGANGDPDKVAMDKSGANKAAIDAINGACQIFGVKRGHEIIPKGKFHDRRNDHKKAQKTESTVPVPR